ncbi:MAG: adenosylcobinamide-phosphate synthase CbiB [Burkholderiaceae bacterium]|nr:adenosylcobinamide-phosphate synthase CbiB [Burkholderiaceae bacterium]
MNLDGLPVPGAAAPTLAIALALAWAWDARWGEPADRWHPVAWLGRLLGPLGRWLCGRPPRQALIGGALAWLALAAALAVLAAGWQAATQALPIWLGAPLAALALKPLFAWRMLRDEVAAVEAALAESLSAGRSRLAWLVSRDTAALDAAQVREAALETLAENLNDSLVSPLLWLLLAGLPGMAVYRLANTADAMWGYRGRWEWAGKWAARADDVLSWPGARLTALALRLAAGWRRVDARQLAVEARRTPSPNGGWPMGTLALALDVRLGKPAVYTLHAAGRSPTADDLARGLQLAARAAWGAAAGAFAWLLLIGWVGGRT